MKILSVAAAAAAILLASIPSHAQEWPQRPVTLVVAAAAGGPIDVFGRVLAERMGQALGQSVLIENVPGAGGMMGGNRVARAAPDGYTAILGTIATHAHSQLLYKSPLYHAVKDFAPVMLIAEIPLVLIARKDFPANTFEEFVAYAKANPGKLNYGSAGPGSASHLGCVLLGKAIGADLQHVPYKGTGPAMQDLQAGRLDISCEIVVTAVPQVQAGNLKAFATLSKDRSPVLPDLPTAFEKGFQNIQIYTWTALLFPAGTSAAIVEKMRVAARKALAEPDTRGKLEALGATLVSADRTTPDYLRKFLQDEIDKWSGPIRDSGALPQ